MPLLIFLGLVISLSGAVAHEERTPGAQSSGVNLNKPAHFQVWRKITLGTYKGVDAYRRALDLAGIKIGDAADEILGRPGFPYGTMKTDLELVLISAADLGVETESSLADVYRRARRAGLQRCPAEVGPQLRLDYRDQRLGEALTIAMEPIATYNGEPTILALANFAPSGLLLIGSDGRPEFILPSTFRFVFALPTNELLEAMTEPQVVPTSPEQTN